METQLTPDQQAHIDALDRQLIHTPTVKELIRNDQALEQGQEEIIKEMQKQQKDTAAAFSEGKENFKELFRGLANVRQDMESNNKLVMDAITGLSKQISEKESAELKDEVRNLRDEIKIRNNQKWDIIKFIITGFIGLGFLAVAAYYGLK